MKGSFRIALALGVLATAATAATARAEVTIQVASFPSFDESVKAAIPLWEKKHPDVKVRLQSLAFGDHHNAMITALASGTNLPDVMAVEISFIGRFAESRDALEDLGAPPYDGKPLLERLLKFTRSQAQSGTGILAAMPADVGPGTLFYRKDILDRAGITEAELTRSWESYIEAGRKLKAATGSYLLAGASDIKDIYIRSNLKDGEGIYFGRDAKGGVTVLVRSPRFHRAFELAKKARAAGIDARVGAFSNEWQEGFKRGAIATQAMGAWLAGHLNNWIAPDTKGLWRAAHLPEGAFATWGGSFYAIPKKAEHKQEAWAFIQFMCFDKEQQLNALKSLDAWPALVAAQNDPFIDQPMPFLGGQKARQLWKVAAARAPAIVVNKLDPVAADVVNAELEQVLEREKPIDRALDDAQQQIERRIRQRSP